MSLLSGLFSPLVYFFFTLKKGPSVVKGVRWLDSDVCDILKPVWFKNSHYCL